MSFRQVFTTFLLILVLGAAFAVFVDRRADLREAGIEARFPPIGQFVKVGGRDVHVVVRGTGPDLVLIHGAGGNARDFTYDFIDRLTDHYRVFVVDRPGLGWSERIDPRLNAAFTTDAESPIAQARHLSDAVAQLGATNPIVLGHSFGGAVAMAWALEEPAAGIVIVSGATMPWPGPLQWYYRVFGSAVGSAIGAPLVSAFVTDERIESTLVGLFAPAPVDPGYLAGAAIPLATRTQTFRANARQVKTLRPHLVEMSARYPMLELPVEILHGTADTTVLPEIHAEPLQAALPNASLTLLEGVGHATQHVAPKPVVDAIDRIAARAGLR